MENRKLLNVRDRRDENAAHIEEECVILFATVNQKGGGNT